MSATSDAPPVRATRVGASPTSPQAVPAALCATDVFMELERTMATLSTHTRCIAGAKDRHSRHVASTDAYAALVGLRKGGDVCGRLDCDMPCEGTARFAETFVAEDLEVIARATAEASTATLKTVNIHRYDTGPAAWMFEKRALFDGRHANAIGTIYTAHQIDPNPLLPLLLGGTEQRLIAGSLRFAEGGLSLGAARLTAHEHEIAYLLGLGWTARNIKRLLDHIRPGSTPRGIDSIYKCRARICTKLDAADLGAKAFREMIVATGIGASFPASLIEARVGSNRVA